MADDQGAPALHVPARDIPVPTTVSAEARASFAARAPLLPYPPLDQPAAWRDFVKAREEAVYSLFPPMTPGDAEIVETQVGAAPVYVVTPKVRRVDERFVYLDIHGGGLIMGGGELCRALAATTAARRGAKVWSVDYRMPPDHPYPAGVDDCVATYRALLEQRRPEEIVVGGVSAGGNLAAATILKARDEGLPLPAAAVLLTPELDLTEAGDSFQTNLGLDAILAQSLLPANRLYAGGHDLTHPYVSPLFGDFSKGFPPTFLSAGTRDLFLSNAVRMHWALRDHGVDAVLYVQEAASHGGFFNAPETEQLEREISRFVEARWGRKA
jgi:acetyl esterase/lipase